MAGIRQHRRAVSARIFSRALGLVGLALWLLCGGARAEEAGDLYESPTLTIDPGRPTGAIKGLSVDKAGEYAVTGGEDRVLRVWRVANGELVLTIPVPIGPGNVGSIYAVAISPDGKLIAAGGWTGRGGYMPLYVFERETGRLVKRVGQDMENVANGLVFSPDGRYLAAVLAGGFGLRVFNASADWAQVYRADRYGDDSYGVAFSDDGRLATTCEDGNVRLYGYGPRAETPNFHAIGGAWRTPSGRELGGVAFSPDGKRLAIGYFDVAAIDILDASTHISLGPPHPADVHMDPDGLGSVAWSLDGGTVFAGGSVKDVSNRLILFAWSHGGAGAEKRMTYCGADSLRAISPLKGGDILVASALPCLSRLNPAGRTLWRVNSPIVDMRGQSDKIGVSEDGKVIDFWRSHDERRIRFDTRVLTLSSPNADDGLTSPPLQKGLTVDWRKTHRPTLDGEPLPIDAYDVSRSLALAPGLKRLYLGSSYAVTAFDTDRAEKWRVSTASGEAWAVNASQDGHLVVVAYADGSVRWLRAADGVELLALQVLPNDGEIDQWDWVLWTPEGYYAATKGAEDALRWIVNHGPDTTPTVHPVSQFKYLNQPAALKLVLGNLETARALGLAKITEDRFKVQKQTGSAKPAGGVLHLLMIGVGNFGPRAMGLGLDFAAEDARQVWNALVSSQTPGPDKPSLYADVAHDGLLVDEGADKKTILNRLDHIADGMKAAAQRGTPDTAVIFITTHGEMVGHGVNKKLYLMTYGVDLSGGENDLALSALKVDDFAEKIADIAGYGHVLVLLDACHSGDLSHEMDVEALSVALDPNSRDNIAVLTSTQTRAEEAHNLPSYGRSAFTQALLDALGRRDDPDGVIKLGNLVENMGQDLEQLTHALPPPRQRLGAHPHFYGSLFVANPP